MTGDGLGRGLSDMWRSVLLFVPAALAFAAILLVGYLIARLLRTAVTRGLHKAGLDRAVERGAAARLFGAGRTTASELCGLIAFYGILLFALQLAFGIWGPNPVSTLLTDLIAWLPRLFVAIVLVIVAAAIARAAHDLIEGALGALTYGRVLARAASIVIVALGVIAALDQVRIATSVTQPLLIAVLATVAGVLIVGVGGGLIRPMQQRWDTWLQRADAESATIRDHARAYAADRARQAEADRQAEAGRQAAIEAREAEEARARQADADRLRQADRHAAAQAHRSEEGSLSEDDQARQAVSAYSTDPDAAAATQVIRAEPHADHLPAEETQVIPPPRQAGEEDVAAPEEDAATVISSGAADTTIVNPGPNETLVIGPGEIERTQVLPPAETTTTRPLPTTDDEDHPSSNSAPS